MTALSQTRTYADRLQTLDYVRESGIKVCAGGIMGLGESRRDRAGLLMQLANLSVHPESVPINMLVRSKGTPLESAEELDPFEFIRCIAVARIMMPKSHVRLSAGRTQMNDQTQALAFFAGANSLFYGETLLTTPNPEKHNDTQLFIRLGILPEERETNEDEVHVEGELEKEIQQQADKHFFTDAASEFSAASLQDLKGKEGVTDTQGLTEKSA